MWYDNDQISFAEWLVELNICAIRAGYQTPLLPQTGQLSWYSYFAEGLSPREALREKEQEGFLWGDDYSNAEE